MRISEVAAASGVSIQTLRYYERRGLVAPTARAANGYRIYGDEVIDRLRFIRIARELGFAVDEVSEMLSLLDGDHPPGDAQAIADARLADVRRRAACLGAIERALTVCAAREEQSCPLYEELAAVEEAWARPTAGPEPTGALDGST